MGKLVDTLRQVGQSAGGSLGFLARTPARAPRPAAIFVSAGADAASAVEAAVKNGVDGVIVAGWTSATKTQAITSALGSSTAIWGVQVAEGAAPEGLLKAAQEAGASFAILDRSAPARLLLDELERFDLVVTVDVPKDDLSLVLQRAENLLPAQAALVRAELSGGDLARLSLGEFARLRLVMESLRFPALVTLREAPPTEAVRTLARLGLDAVVLPATGEGIGEQVKALREELEKTPPSPDDRDTVRLGGMLSTTPQPQTQPETPTEPDEQ